MSTLLLLPLPSSAERRGDHRGHGTRHHERGSSRRARLASSRPAPLPPPPPRAEPAGPVLSVTQLAVEDAGAPAEAPSPAPPPTLLPLLGAGTLPGDVVRGLCHRLRAHLSDRDLLRLYASLYTSLAAGGRTVLGGFASPQLLEQALASVAREDALDLPALATLVSERFPALITAPDGWLWRRKGPRYQRVPLGPSPLAAVDDVTGTLYASDGSNEGAPLIHYDEATAQWRPTGVRDARSVAASAGTLFALLADGRLMSYRRGEGISQLSARSFHGTVHAGGGALYVLDDHGVSGGAAELYRLRDHAWERRGEPLASGLRRVVASGATWYALDSEGHLRWGERDGRVLSGSGASRSTVTVGSDIADLWLLGRDLLVLTEADQLFLFSAERSAWITLDR